MTYQQAIEARHSVRTYTDRPIEPEKAEILTRLTEQINRTTGLHFQLVCNEPQGFSGMMAHYGRFRGVKNYFVLAGPEGKDLEVGYYGEQLVLKAQTLGLNTCWVAMTFNRKKAVYTLAPGEKMYVVISLGYGDTQGVPHRSKPLAQLSDLSDSSPDWYRRGVQAALLAPTAVNQQKFRFTLNGDKVSAAAGGGFCTQMDLGIVMCHFDVGSGRNSFGMGAEEW